MRLLFRDDLTCTRDERQGVAVYNVEDPNTGATYRLYEIEYLITQKLDGSRDPEDVVTEIKRDFGFDMTLEDFEQFSAQLMERGFLRRVDPEAEQVVGELGDESQPASPDGAATQVFVAPVDNTATQRFEITDTARLIAAGDTSHLAPPKPPDKLKLFVAAISALAVALFCIWGLAMLMVSPVGVVIEASQPKEVPVYFSDEGAQSVRPQREAWLSFGASGKLKELNASHGDSVKQGEIIAALAIPGSMQRQLDRARENLKQKKKKHELILVELDKLYSQRASIEAERSELDRLMNSKSSGKDGKRPSRKKLRKWRNQRADKNKSLSGLVRKERKLREREQKLQLGVAKAKTSLETRELKLHSKLLRAPFDGIIAETQLLREEQSVDSDMDVVRVLDPRRLELLFRITDFDGHRVGAEISVSVIDEEQTRTGTIQQVTKQEEVSQVTVVIPDPEGALSMLAPSDFFLVKDFRDPAFETERNALREIDGQADEIPVVRDGHIAWVPVRVLRRTPKTVLIEPVGDYIIAETDSFVVKVPDGDFSDLDDGMPAEAVVE